jgi:hypothetical protein
MTIDDDQPPYIGNESQLPRPIRPMANPNEEPLQETKEGGQQEVWPFNKPFIKDQTQAADMTLKEQYDALRDRDTTFIFLFGPPGSGKTAITSSLAFHMGTDEEGELRVRDEANIRGKALLQDIFKRVRTGTFLERSNVGNVYEIDLTYTPLRKRKEMNFTFLEMSGEDLKEIEIKPNATTNVEFIPQIDVYLGAPKLDILFFLVVDFSEAPKWDGLMVAFLDYIAQRRENHRIPKVLLLVSKWDAYTGRHKRNNDITGFVKENMPMTFGRLNAVNGVIDYYTVGEVEKDEIISFGPIRAAAVKRWMYYSISGIRLPGNASWLERLLAFVGL